MIRLKNLERSYKTAAGETWVLRRIDLTIPEGEFLTVMGPSGAGKSSLLNALALLDDQWAGEYWFREQPVHLHEAQGPRRDWRNATSAWSSRAITCSTISPWRRTSIFRCLTKTFARSERQAMVADTLDRFQIVAKKDLYPSQLSGGQQQLVGIARAVIHKPALLLADEPTGNLHSSQAKEIMELFSRTQSPGHDNRAGHALRRECVVRQRARSTSAMAGWSVTPAIQIWLPQVRRSGHDRTPFAVSAADDFALFADGQRPGAADDGPGRCTSACSGDNPECVRFRSTSRLRRSSPFRIPGSHSVLTCRAPCRNRN